MMFERVSVAFTNTLYLDSRNKDFFYLTNFCIVPDFIQQLGTARTFIQFGQLLLRFHQYF